MRLLVSILAVFVTALSVSANARAVGFRVSAVGQEVLETQEATRAKKLPELVTTVALPADLGFSEMPTFIASCGMTALIGTTRLKNVRGKATAYLDHTDLESGVVERVKIGGGKFRTGADGRGRVQLEVEPRALLDAAALDDDAFWITWIVQGRNSRKIDLLSAFCANAVSLPGN